MQYNFLRVHQTLRVRPAMAAGVTTRLYAYEKKIVERFGGQHQFGFIIPTPAPLRAPGR
jgi:hypothetical protein